METCDSINARATRIMAGLEQAFGVRGKDLSTALRRTGRRMPRRLHKAAAHVVAAQAFGNQPKLMRQVDGPALDRAERDVLSYLNRIDRADQRRARLLNTAGLVVLNVLLVIAGFILWMWWSGQI
ncbi:MAG: hypothetical protein AAF601_16190 [Pseudomonadota bacterium]